MDNTVYELRYLPMFYEEFDEKVSYIAKTLKNREAAEKLINNVEKAIIERLPNAESFEPYHSIKERRYPYYRIYVDHYVIYYVVIRDQGSKPIMEIRRFLHETQNRDNII